jgi:peptidylprolyl isomerase
MSKIKDGQTVSVHYVGTFDDGTEFDSSRQREEPLSFQIGSGQLIPGFNDAVAGMILGETKQVCLQPTEAYGEVDPDAVQTVSKEVFPGDFDPVVGQTVMGQNEDGGQLMAKINSFDDEGITLDFNHPMAGKTLNFEIEVISVG